MGFLKPPKKVFKVPTKFKVGDRVEYVDFYESEGIVLKAIPLTIKYRLGSKENFWTTATGWNPEHWRLSKAQHIKNFLKSL